MQLVKRNKYNNHTNRLSGVSGEENKLRRSVTIAR